MAKKTEQKKERYATTMDIAKRYAKETDADALLVWALAKAIDWSAFKKKAGDLAFVVAGDSQEVIQTALDAEIPAVVVESSDAPIHEKLEQALLQAIADEVLSPGGGVVAIYGCFDAKQSDTISYIQLDEHLGRLTARDLRNLGTRVPLDTLKVVVDLAVDIGREGREGKPVGTMFVVGDTRNVLSYSHPTGFDPVKGYNRKERNLTDSKVREGIKEVAQLDGAFVVSADGTVEASCQLIETSAANVTLSKGLGTRHWAGAAITKKTNAVAIAVSESSGTVRIFHKGEVILRVEPFRRAMKWKVESAPAAEESAKSKSS